MQSVKTRGKSLPCATRVIVGKLKLFGNPRQLLSPVNQMVFDRLLIQAAPLPEGEIRILDGKRWQWIRPALMEVLIQQHEFAIENADRPAVKNNVVKAAQQHVLVPAQLQ